MEKTKNIDLLKPLLKKKRHISNEVSKLMIMLNYEYGHIQLRVLNYLNKKKSRDLSFYHHIEQKKAKSLKKLTAQNASPYDLRLKEINQELELKYWELRQSQEEYKKTISDHENFEELSSKHLADLYLEYDELEKNLLKSLSDLDQKTSNHELFEQSKNTIDDEFTKSLIKRIQKDQKIFTTVNQKLSQHNDIINDLCLRIMDDMTINELISGHLEIVNHDDKTDYKALQESRNQFLRINYNTLLFLEKYSKIKGYYEKIADLNEKLHLLDQDIHSIVENHQDYQDNHLVYMQENPDIHLSLKNLKMYFGGLKAVDDLTFDIKRGEIFSLIGPNGAGKTTVFNCITQFYKPTSGEVYINNHLGVTKRLNDYKVHEVINQGIARTFQNVELINELTVFENLLVGSHAQFKTNLFQQMFKSPKARTEEKILQIRAYNILMKLKLTNYMFSYPQGLPYGILKRVELARSLMTNPEIIILDEPAAGLNETETKELIRLIRSINKEFNVTIFLVEHDMSLVMEVSDRVCAISFGKMLAIGSPQEIQSNPVVQEAYLGGDRDE